MCLNDDYEYKEDNTIRSRLHEICVHNILLLNCFDKSFRSGETSNRQTVCVPVAAPTSVGLPVVHIHTQNITQVVGSTIGSIISPLSFSTTIQTACTMAGKYNKKHKTILIIKSLVLVQLHKQFEE